MHITIYTVDNNLLITWAQKLKKRKQHNYNCNKATLYHPARHSCLQQTTKQTKQYLHLYLQTTMYFQYHYCVYLLKIIFVLSKKNDINCSPKAKCVKFSKKQHHYRDLMIIFNSHKVKNTLTHWNTKQWALK